VTREHPELRRLEEAAEFADDWLRVRWGAQLCGCCRTLYGAGDDGRPCPDCGSGPHWPVEVQLTRDAAVTHAIRGVIE
jgi:hypothetical protein